MSKQKWSVIDGTCAEAFSWPVEHLGSDEHGTWLGSRRGSPVRQPDGRSVEAQERDAVWLVSEGAWWLPAFWFTDETDLTIDICTPPRLDGGVWTFVDLELDLFRSADGRAGVVDRDEFDQLAASGHLADSHVVSASEAAQTLLPLVQTKAEPFGDAARPWLRALRA
jgi:predicted RNA-binding protein associated with RNAse of E/G family